MFTGIVEELGTVQSVVHGTRSVKLTIQANIVLSDVHIGDSIAVNGVCLTVVSFTRGTFTADVMPETVRRTALARLHSGTKVNLERALSVHSRLGGHIVSGHVDGLGEIVAVDRDDNALLVKIKVDMQLAKYIIEKGSVAIDGISLTVVECTDDSFAVSLIPHTAAVTTLGYKTVGDLVNIENDIIGKYVERLLFFEKAEPQKPEGKITLDFLTKHGF